MECCLSAGNRARPLPFMFSLNPHLLQERKELTFYKHTKAQSNLSLGHSDQGCGKTETLTSQAPTKLDLLPGKYRLDTRHSQAHGRGKLNPPVTPMFLVQDQPLIEGQWSLLVHCDYHNPAAMKLFPHYEYNFSGF